MEISLALSVDFRTALPRILLVAVFWGGIGRGTGSLASREVWLADVLERLPAMTNRDDLGVLLPSRWQTATAPAANTAEACPV